MALAAAHIIIAIFILDLFRHYVFGKKKFPRYLLIVGGIAGLGPDIDVILTWVFQFITGSSDNLHGTFTHSFFFVSVFLVIALFFNYQKDKKWARIFYVISAGWLVHLFLDWLYGEYKFLFWPFPTPMSIFPNTGIVNYAIEIDAIILVLWLVHEEIYSKIKDYY